MFPETFMVRFLLIVYALFAATASAQTATSDLIRADEQKRLEACLKRQDEDPEEAYEDALAWQQEGATANARYCVARALITLEEYEEGAIRLEELAVSRTLAIAVEDRALFMAQAGNAWLLAGLPEEAIVALSEALRFNQFSAELYQDRARAFLMQQKWVEGEADLDQALSIQPGDLQSYILRGRTRLAQERLDEAWADVEQGMAIDISNVELLVLRGDVREAQRVAGGE